VERNCGGKLINMKQKYLIIIFILLIGFTGSSMAVADNYEELIKNKVIIIVNGEELNTFDQVQKVDMPAFIYNDRTLLPLRTMFRIFDIVPKWNPKNRSITAEGQNKKIWLQIDNENVKVNEQNMKIDVPAKIFDNRTYVPVRFISETFGIQPIWDGVKRRVIINTLEKNIFLKDFNVSFKAKDEVDFGQPVKLRDSMYQIMSKSRPGTKIYIVKHSEKIDKTLLKITAEIPLKTEDFTEISKIDNRNIYYGEYLNRLENTKTGIFLTALDKSTLIWYFYGMDFDSAKEIVESIY
jgi:hypothetical protein